MELSKFIVSNEIPFIPINRTFNDETNTKQMKGMPREYNNFDFKMSLKHFEQYKEEKKKFNQILMKIPDNIICFDTDTKEVYNKLTKYLNESCLYDEESITESFSCRNKNLHFKKHFYFKILMIEDEEKINVKKLIPHKLGKNGIDIFYDCWGVAEYNDIKMSESIKLIDIDNIKEIFELFDIKSNDDKNNKNKQIEKIKYQYNNDYELITILDSLNSSRWNDYNEWLILYCIFLNENLPKGIFDKYSKKHSNKYDETLNKKVLSSLTPIEKGYRIGTLFQMLKEDNIDIFNQLKKTKPNINSLIQTISEMTIAETYYNNYEKNTYVYDEDNDIWYMYNKYNILVEKKKAPSDLQNNISKTFIKLFSEEKNKLKIPDNIHGEEYEIKKKQFIKQLNAYDKAIKTVGTAKVIKGSIEFLKNMYKIDDFEKLKDNNNNVIAFKDGYLYDIKAKEYRQIKPSDYISKTMNIKTPLNVNENKLKQINNIIYSIFEKSELTEYWLKVFGISLFTNKAESIYILTGKGGNGKGLLMNLIKDCLGSYYQQAETTFLTNAIRAGSANPTLAKCKGIRFLSVSEPESAENDISLNTEFIKALTGRDTITARDLYKTNISYEPMFNCFLQCNNIPCIKKLDNGMIRRLKIIRYPFNFVESDKLKDDKNNRLRDENLKDSLIEDEELKQAFIYLLIKYATENINKTINIPDECKEFTKQYINDNNPIKDFIDNKIIKTDNKNDRIITSDLYKLFKSSTQDEKTTAKKFYDDMLYNGFEKSHKINGYQYYQFIQIVQESKQDQEQEHDKYL